MLDILTLTMIQEGPGNLVIYLLKHITLLVII